MPQPEPQTRSASARHRRLAGVTLIELMVVVGLITVIVGLTLPNVSEWRENQRLRSTARNASDLFLLARSEAIRTGNRYIVFFGNPGTQDPSGNDVEVGGSWVPVLVIDDGPPATSNCAIDAGEIVQSITPEDGMGWGVAGAGAAVPTDTGAAPFDPSPPPAWDGATFADPAGAKVNWVMFRPDGVPVSFVGALGSCGAVGATGSGGGALYVTNGGRDYSLVLSPLGGVRLHSWNVASGGWSS